MKTFIRFHISIKCGELCARNRSLKKLNCKIVDTREEEGFTIYKIKLNNENILNNGSFLLYYDNKDTSNVEYNGMMFHGTKANIGYARTQKDADFFNNSSASSRVTFRFFPISHL